MLESLSRMVPALILIVGLIIGIYVFIQFRRGTNKSRKSKIKITRATSLGGKTRLIEVVWQGKILLLSSNSDQVNLIAESTSTSTSTDNLDMDSDLLNQQDLSFIKPSTFENQVKSVFKQTNSKNKSDNIEPHPIPDIIVENEVVEQDIDSESSETANITNKFTDIPSHKNDDNIMPESATEDLNISDILKTDNYEESQVAEMQNMLEKSNIEESAQSIASEAEVHNQTYDTQQETPSFEKTVEKDSVENTNMNKEEVDKFIDSTAPAYKQEDIDSLFSDDKKKNTEDSTTTSDAKEEDTNQASNLEDPFALSMDTASSKISNAAEEAAEAHKPIEDKN